ncbi:MAG TPA: transcription-repair coupling factor [Candidatus Acidoferrales bacterium]|nr:transcription-repair coupling factor [Candidatus Acidoferrales bacterium]
MTISTLDDLFARVTRLPSVDSAVETLRRGAREAALDGLTSEGRVILAAVVAASLRRPTIFVVDSETRAEAILEPLRFFFQEAAGSAGGSVLHLPSLSAMPWDEIPPHPAILEARSMALWRMATGQAQIVVASVAATIMKYQSAESYEGLGRTVARDIEISLDEFLEHLDATGYVRAELADMPGQYASRGGIVDVFPPEAANPVRIELVGDTVESLREFHPDTQRSIRPVEQVTLPPLSEFLRSKIVYAASDGAEPRAREGETNGAQREIGNQSLFDLVPRTLVILEEPEEIEAAAKKLFPLRVEEAVEEDINEVNPAHAFDEASWKTNLAAKQRLILQQLSLSPSAGPSQTVRTQPTQRYHGNITAFMTEARARVAQGEQVIVSAATLGDLERLADLCHEYELPYQLSGGEDIAATRLVEDATAGSVPALVLARIPIADGVAFPECRLTIYGTGDLFDERAAVQTKSRAKTGKFFSDFGELKPGDYVVHVDHGIGKFEGLRQLQAEGGSGEFMLLLYADDARLYVPVARMDLIQGYRALEGVHPQLDKLGGPGWATRKARVKKSLTEMADQLVRLYASRKLTGAHAFPADSQWQKEFEDAFEYDETPDQAAAITDLKRDMEKPIPMDRLLCGDVGYGKTEVAMRAAFKAVTDGKQVAVLAPTTVLVFQHYETFRRRFAAFPVNVEMLSRFRTPQQQKQTLASIEAGKADIVIGTHRLLSRDVKFQDLGILIVDEEQRFGVADKERIKELRKDVHVLTLSATPIPRTLHMSLLGLRDLSVIETPPKDRLAIQTVVAPFEEGLVRKAIEEELARKGQVYFIHNRVESIYSLASLINKLVPKARVVVGHGQMGERELESVMLKFMNDEADVLVSTTIVENGMDIPRANTILINRADRLGLSELYQLRGRVGRSNQRAYAYLLVPPAATLTPTARKRLAAMKEFSELGAGFRIAALDLEIRGAGNLLGRQQHGHINAVGFDLYTKMLERAVSELRGESSATDLRATINLGADVRIPPVYIASENLRLRTYKRIAEIATETESDEVLKELGDRFGPAPQAVKNLLDYALLKAAAEKMQVASVERRDGKVAVKFHPETTVNPARIVELLRARRGLRLDPGGVLWIDLERGTEPTAVTVRKILLQLQV